MIWKDGTIHDCRVIRLKKYSDRRGWLAEVFRQDELEELYHPVMGYLSLTHPGISRGPHEHENQADLFIFFSGHFRLYLWDTRKKSATVGTRQRIELGEATPASVLIPPGIVHAYRNIGSCDALIFNCPNALYAGQGKRHSVDEIRHEDAANHLFIMD